MTTPWKPKWGDPELLPKPDKLMPSRERMPFDNGGRLKPEGPGPQPAGFLLAPDIKGLPWTRSRGDEWTTPEFREFVLIWVREFFRDRPSKSLSGWDIVERGTAVRLSLMSLLPKDQYLLIGITRRIDSDTSSRVEVAIAFPVDTRATKSVALAHLAIAAKTLDALIG